MMQEPKKMKRTDSAVSEMIGSVMLISVVVTAIAIIGVVLTSQPPPQKIPALDAIISSNGKNIIGIYHGGGDTVSRQEITILVDGVDRTSNFTIRGSGWTTWSQGETLDYISGSLPGKVQIIYNGGSSQTVLVSADFASGMPTSVLTAIPTPVAAAMVTGITPNVGITGSSISTSISGSGFVNGATVTLTRGASILTATNIMVVSQNQVTCGINLYGAATGQWTVVVTNPGSLPGTLANGFTVIPAGPAPAVSRITPNSGTSGSVVSIGNLTGTYFVSGALVKLSRLGNPDLFASNVNVLDSTNLTCTLTLPAGTSPGSWDVTVINTDGQSGLLSNGFRVDNPGLTVTGITPNSGISDSSVAVTNLAGTGFETFATVRLNSSSYPAIPATGVVVVNQNQISCVFDLTGAPFGIRNIVVTNTDGREGMLVNGFTIAANAPAITGISPNTGVQGTAVSGITLAGSGFQNNAMISLTRSGYANITANTVAFVSPSQITCSFNLTDAATGSWNIVVTNPDNQSGSLANGFTVNPPTSPEVSAILPVSSLQITPVSITIAGSGFQNGANVTLVKGGDPIQVGSSVVVVSPNLITCQFNLVGDTPGPWDVVITNSDGQSGNLPGALLVKSPLPTVTAITNITQVRGWTVIERVSGTNFLSGAVVRFVNSTAGPDIIATNVNVVSATQITCKFDLAGATAAKRSVTVTNPYSDTGTLANGFTVTGAAPVLSVRAPTSANRGWPVGLTLTGTGFQPGATVKLTRSGYSDIIATGVTAVSPTQITCTFNLLGATSGTWNIMVTNTDGQSSGTVTFTVNAVTPAFTSNAPATGARSAAPTITIIGTGFQPGATVTYTRAPTTISLTNINVISPTQITGTLVIPAGATTGLYSVTITNTDSSTVTSANKFTVT
jgi:hypothetical protein